MSDEENEEEEDEEEEDSEENSSDGDSQQSAEDGVDSNKAQQVSIDMKLIGDIFEYIDNNTYRITLHGSMVVNDKTPSPSSSVKQYKPGPNREKRDINWSNYDLLNDVERAKLLEKAISMLATDDQVI